ncbi:MAG TPA: hypothetical protein VM241_04725 [Candidatus Thermoplasmatota archaeon]|nr:hypothetical protein [Candidatus Thermoplasmatota archaeon]
MRAPWLLAALLALPAAQATLTLHAEVAAGPLQPGTGSANGTATITLDCTQALLRAQDARGPHPDVPVALRFAAPPEVAATIDSSVGLPVAPCQGGAATTQATTTFSVGLALEAPAGRPLGFNLTADLPADPALAVAAPAESKSFPLSVKATAYVLVAIEAPQAIHLTQPTQQVSFLFTNQGNLPVRIAGTVAFGTPLVGAAPAALSLGHPASPASGAPRGSLAFDVHAPDVRQVQEFTGKATFEVRAEDGTPGRTLEAHLFFRNEIPAPKSSPAPAVALLGLLLLGVAAARRRA